MNGNGAGPHAKPWGHKVTASIYFEGAPTDGGVQDAIEKLSQLAPEATFIGVSIETVQDEPQDQGAS